MKPEIKRPLEAQILVTLNEYETRDQGHEVWEAVVKLGGREFDLTTDGSPGRCLDYALKWANDRGYVWRPSMLQIKVVDKDEAAKRYNDALNRIAEHRIAAQNYERSKRLGRGV